MSLHHRQRVDAVKKAALENPRKLTRWPRDPILACLILYFSMLGFHKRSQKSQRAKLMPCRRDRYEDRLILYWAETAVKASQKQLTCKSYQ